MTQTRVFVLRTKESAAGGPPAVTPAPTTPRPPLASTEDAPTDTPAHPLATGDVSRLLVTA